VFRATGGNYLQRSAGMLIVTVFFWAKMVEHQARMMHAAKLLWSPRAWAGLGPMLFGRPGILWKLALPYLAYFRPSFHPRELDCTALLDRWKADFATQPEYRQSVLKTAA
jgi:hypothetical protein